MTKWFTLPTVAKDHVSNRICHLIMEWHTLLSVQSNGLAQEYNIHLSNLAGHIMMMLKMIIEANFMIPLNFPSMISQNIYIEIFR